MDTQNVYPNGTSSQANNSEITMQDQLLIPDTTMEDPPPRSAVSVKKIIDQCPNDPDSQAALAEYLEYVPKLPEGSFPELQSDEQFRKYLDSLPKLDENEQFPKLPEGGDVPVIIEEDYPVPRSDFLKDTILPPTDMEVLPPSCKGCIPPSRSNGLDVTIRDDFSDSPSPSPEPPFQHRSVASLSTRELKNALVAAINLVFPLDIDRLSFMRPIPTPPNAAAGRFHLLVRLQDVKNPQKHADKLNDWVEKLEGRRRPGPRRIHSPSGLVFWFDEDEADDMLGEDQSGDDGEKITEIHMTLYAGVWEILEAQRNVAACFTVLPGEGEKQSTDG